MQSNAGPRAMAVRQQVQTVHVSIVFVFYVLFRLFLLLLIFGVKCRQH